MRPGQQNKRGRGRGNNPNGGGGGGGGGNNNNNNNGFNRKGGNPLTRTYDSSGPDVKIRGTAQHIAEKYSNLARDAQSSGDRVMAENYLQHAEHYNRIIASAQAQMQERFQRDERSDYNEREGDDIEGGDNEDGVTAAPAPQQQPQQHQPQPQPQQQQPRPPREPREPRQPRPPVVEPVVIDGTGPQPVIEGTPVEVAAEEAEQAVESPARAPRRRATGARPRRPRRTAEGEGDAGGEGDASAPDQTSEPSLADVPGE